MTTPSGRRVLLEVGIASVADAIAARDGGADRVELNAALMLGGLTPSLGTLVEVRRVLAIPVIVMIRPRAAGFRYEESEFAVMRRDVDLALEHGADGVAFGLLTASGEIDAARCRQVLEQVGDRQAVFHRAFDVTPDPFAALEILIDLGFRRVMTSGQEESAYRGSARIAELIGRARGRVEVLPAGGIDRFTLADVLARTGCDQVHASLRASRADPSTAARPRVAFGGSLRPPEDRYEATDPSAVAELRSRL